MFGNVKLAIPKIMLVSWLTKLIQNLFDVCFEMPSDSKNFGCVVDKFSELADTTKLLGCQHLENYYDQTTGHSLK